MFGSLRDHPREVNKRPAAFNSSFDTLHSSLIEDTFQKGIAFARTPQEYRGRVEAVVRSVETDDGQMQEITDWAENEVLAGPQEISGSGEGE